MSDALQSKFGTDQIAFSSGNGGLMRASIRTAAAEGEIYLHGAHVTKFQPRGAEAVLYLSSASLFRADKPIRGGVPICWPWFGAKADDPAAPMHGFARLSEWAVEATSKIDEGTASIVLKLESNEATRKFWPFDFLCRCTVTVGAALQIALETTNRSSGSFIITEALHSYLHVGDVGHVIVRGLTGASYYDKVANARKIESRDPLQLSGETDNVYLNSRTAITVQDLVLKRKIVVEKSGSSSTVMWNPFGEKAKAMADVGPGEWKNFLCVEATNALENAVTLAPGASHMIRETIRVSG